MLCTLPHSPRPRAGYTLAAAAIRAVKIAIPWATADDDAVADEHYIADSGQLIIPAEARRAEFAVALIGGDAEEPARRVRLRLDSVDNVRAFRRWASTTSRPSTPRACSEYSTNLKANGSATACTDAAPAAFYGGCSAGRC